MSTAPDWSSVDPLGYYTLLGVLPDATPEEIQAAYRREAMRWHPDTNDSVIAEEWMVRINEAFAALSEPRRRAAYDTGAATGGGTGVDPDLRPPSPVVSPAVVDFGTLTPGNPVQRTIVIANTGGPPSTVKIEPEDGPWFRILTARAGSSDNVVAEVDVEAFVPASRSRKKTLEETLEVSLDGVVAEVRLEASVSTAPDARTAPSATVSPKATGASVRWPTSSAGSMTRRYLERQSRFKRIWGSAVSGLLTPVALIGSVSEQYEQLDVLTSTLLFVIALLLFAAFVYCAWATVFFTRLAWASPWVVRIAAGLVVLGWILFWMGVAALVALILLAILAIIITVFVIAALLGIVGAAFGG